MTAVEMNRKGHLWIHREILQSKEEQCKLGNTLAYSKQWKWTHVILPYARAREKPWQSFSFEHLKSWAFKKRFLCDLKIDSIQGVTWKEFKCEGGWGQKYVRIWGLGSQIHCLIPESDCDSKFKNSTTESRSQRPSPCGIHPLERGPWILEV